MLGILSQTIVVIKKKYFYMDGLRCFVKGGEVGTVEVTVTVESSMMQCERHSGLLGRDGTIVTIDDAARIKESRNQGIKAWRQGYMATRAAAQSARSIVCAEYGRWSCVCCAVPQGQEESIQ
jgi:hypothetical protein